MAEAVGLLRYRVQSRSWPAQWHLTDLARDECSCSGHSYAGRCWHLDAMADPATRLDALARGRQRGGEVA